MAILCFKDLSLSLHHYLITYLLTQWSTVLLEKLICSQLVKKFPAFLGIRMFITAFTSAKVNTLKFLWLGHVPLH